LLELPIPTNCFLPFTMIRTGGALLIAILRFSDVNTLKTKMKTFHFLYNIKTPLLPHRSLRSFFDDGDDSDVDDGGVWWSVRICTQRYNAYKYHWSEKRLPVILEVNFASLDQVDPSTRRTLCSYDYKDIEGLAMVSVST